MVFGLGICILSYPLVSGKAHSLPARVTENEAIITNYIPPNAILEFILLSLCFAILIIGIFQWKARVRAANIQIIISLIMVSINLFLGVRAASIGHYEISSVYYLAYLTITLGIVVFFIGVAQIIGMINKYHEVKHLKNP